MLERAVSGEPLTLYGAGAYIRDFIHIEDVVAAFRAAMNEPRLWDGRAHAIASGRGCTLAEAYQLIAEVGLQQTGRVVKIARVHEPSDLHLIEKRNFIGDSRAFRDLTGWRPRFRVTRWNPRLFRPRRCADGDDMNQIGDARLIDLPRHARADGEVIVAEAAAQVPFRIERMFVLAAPAGAERGRHAHRRCSQFMICVSGAVDVVCEDGQNKDRFALERRDQALLVPPGLWNTVEFRKNELVLIVLCDRVYEGHDYIHDYAEFLSFREFVHA